MEKHAIIIVYSGIEPDRETVRDAAEAVAKGVHMDAQTMEVTVLNDKEIAQAIVAKTLNGNVYVGKNALYNATQRVVLEMKSDGYTPEKEAVVLTNKYISCVVSETETELSRAMNMLYDSSSKLEIIKQIKDQTGWDLAEIKDLVDLIFSTIQSCRGRFGK